MDVYRFDGGLVEFVKHLNKSRKPLHPKPMYVETTKDNVEVQCAIQYNDSYTETLFTYVNNINTHEGGTHLSGFKAALTRTINAYANDRGLFKKAEFTLSGDDVREGLTAVLSVKVMEPQFEGQTKTKLGNSEVRGIVESVMNEALSSWMQENPGAAKTAIPSRGCCHSSLSSSSRSSGCTSSSACLDRSFASDWRSVLTSPRQPICSRIQRSRYGLAVAHRSSSGSSSRPSPSMLSSVFCSITSCGWICTLKRREVWNSRSSSLPKEISFSGLSKIGLHTARIAASNSSTRFSRGAQPDSMCASATRR